MASIQRLPVAEQVQRLVAERILDGSMTPGTRINEVHLARELGVSRTPLREALQRLHQEGLVSSRPHSGFFVASASRAEAFELYELLALLEADALELSGVPDAAHLERLEQLNEEIATTRTTASAIRRNTAWHRALLSGCANGSLLRLVESTRRKVDRYEHLYFAPGPERIAASVQLHEAILGALGRRDLAEARRSLRIHWLADLEEMGDRGRPAQRIV